MTNVSAALPSSMTGKEFRQARDVLGLTQAGLGVALGVSPVQVSRYENEAATIPEGRANHLRLLVAAQRRSNSTRRRKRRAA